MKTTRTLLEIMVRPFDAFFRTESAGGIVLMVATVVALGFANSPWAAAWEAAWEAPLTIGTGSFGLTMPVVLWINDLLLAVFFLVAGLEIKRELLVGELSSLRKAALPALAAVGGMVVPAGLFLLLVREPAAARGWGIPMTADIAFALGCLKLLGSRVPTGLIVYLTALAIIDDLGAVLVLGIFYTDDVSFIALGAGLAFTAALVVMNRLGVRRPSLYVLAGLPLWIATVKSGLHPTLAGVIIAACLPARARYSRQEILHQAKELLALAETPNSVESDAALEALEHRMDDCESPLSRVVEGLHPWVAFGILPLFALANAGVSLAGGAFAALFTMPSLAIVVSLFIGNQVGVFGTTFFAVKTGLSPLPPGVTWQQMYGMSLLAGVGFTMSLFIAGVAYGQGTPLLQQARLAVLVGSLLSALAGLAVLRWAPAKAKEHRPLAGAHPA